MSGELATKVNEVVSQLLDVCESPLKRSVLFIKETALAAIADRATLHTLNRGLVEKATQQRRKKTRKHCGEARVLTVEEIRVKALEIEEKEAKEGRIKARNKALRGKMGFAKLVWKELSMDVDIFK
jgi:hypothetical protein